MDVILTAWCSFDFVQNVPFHLWFLSSMFNLREIVHWLLMQQDFQSLGLEKGEGRYPMALVDRQWQESRISI